MSLKDAMRKAAGLLVEMSPEDAAASSNTDDFIEPLKTDKPNDKPMTREPDIDKLLAEAGIKPSVPPSERLKKSSPVASTPGAESASSAGAPRAKTVEQIVREADGPNLDQIKAASGDSLVSADGKVNHVAIYRAAKLPDAPFSAEKMLEMLANLPPDVPLEIKRQMVKVTLGALGQSVGATPENIVADASRKLAALAAFVDHYTKQSNEASERMEKEIEELQKQIQSKKTAIENTRSKSTQVTQACVAESERLDDVLEFFSLDVPPSKYARSEKLTPPAT